PRGLSGGLLVLWSRDVVIKHIISNHFCIQLEVDNIGVSGSFWVVFIYASSDKNERIQQWNFLESAR
ncbi:Unknown protein, partial [Striga hermonthica]